MTFLLEMRWVLGMQRQRWYRRDFLKGTAAGALSLIVANFWGPALEKKFPLKQQSRLPFRDCWGFRFKPDRRNGQRLQQLLFVIIPIPCKCFLFGLFFFWWFSICKMVYQFCDANGPSSCAYHDSYDNSNLLCQSNHKFHIFYPFLILEYLRNCALFRF